MAAKLQRRLVPVKMHPVTLAFSDPDLEKRYAVEQFRTACAPCVAFLGVGMLLMVTCSVFDSGGMAMYAFFFVATGSCAAARLWLHRMANQERARRLFGRTFNALILFGWICGVPWLHRHPIEPVSASTVASMALMYFFEPIYMHFSAVDLSHRLAYVVITVLGLLMAPQCSALGRPAEILWLSGALLLGELVGFSLEVHWRKVRCALVSPAVFVGSLYFSKPRAYVLMLNGYHG